MRKLLLFSLLLLMILPLTNGIGMAASLDDPIVKPEVPTVKSEIIRGYEHARKVWDLAEHNKWYYIDYIDQERIQCSLRKESDAFFLGYWAGAWKIFANTPKPYRKNEKHRPDAYINWIQYNRRMRDNMDRRCILVGVSREEVGNLLGINFEDLEDLSADVWIET